MRRTHTDVIWTTLSEGDLVEIQGHPNVPDGVHKVTGLDEVDEADGVPVKIAYTGRYGDNIEHWIRPTDIVRKVEPTTTTPTKAEVLGEIIRNAQDWSPEHSQVQPFQGTFADENPHLKRLIYLISNTDALHYLQAGEAR